MKVPSCVGLPRGWNSENDRCIAYLSTHAPLTANGHVPDQEATLERHSTEAISDFLIANFPKFQHLNVSPKPYLSSQLPFSLLTFAYHTMPFFFITADNYYRRSHTGLSRNAWKCSTSRRMSTLEFHTAATHSRTGAKRSRFLTQLYQR